MQSEADILFRDKRDAACLSHWQLSRWSLGLASPQEMQHGEAHIATCARCAHLRKRDLAEHEAAAFSPLPAALRPRPTRAARDWRMGLSLATAMAGLCAVLWIQPFAHETILLKGKSPLQVALLGDQGSIEEVPVDTLPPLKPGQQLQLRVRTGRASWQALLMRRGTTYDVLFSGPLAADGWLPVGLTVTAGDKSALRVVVCAEAVSVETLANGAQPPGCSVHDADF